MSFFRGQDGSIKWATNVAAQILSWSLRGQAATLETTTMGDKARKRVPGLVTFSGQLAFRLDYGDTLGQKAIVDGLFNAAPATASTALLLIVNGTGPKEFGGNAIISGLNFSQTLENIVEVQADWESDGVWTPTWS